MRRSVLWLLMLPLFGAQSALAQTILERSAGERLPMPRAVEGWQPSTPQLSTTPTTPRVTEDPQLSRQAPGYDVGPFWLFPTITAGVFFDDNVFASSTNRRGDTVAVVRPEIGLRATGANYNITAQGAIEGRGYGRFGSENQVNAAAAVGAIVQPDPDTQLIGRFKYVHAHEDRGVSESLLFPSFDRPVAYNTYEAAGTLNKRAGQWWTSTGAAGLIVQYDAPTIGGIPVDQSYRNGHVIVGTGRLGYVVAPLTSVFVEGQGNRRDFLVNNFDSQGYRAVAGILLEAGPGAVFKGEVFAGYMGQDYQGVTFQTVSTWTYGIALAWLVAPNVTAVFEGRREAKESALLPLVVPAACVTVTVTCGSSLIETLIGARVDYMIVQNLVIGVGATYLIDEFLGANRTDRSWSPLVSVKYLVTPRVTLGFDYRYLNFDSSGLAVPGYYRSVYLFSLNGRM